MNALKGGLADLAKLSDFSEEQLSLGVQAEMEHTNDPLIALEIAMDHLVEDPDYYWKLLAAGLEGVNRAEEDRKVEETTMRVDDVYYPEHPFDTMAKHFEAKSGYTVEMYETDPFDVSQWIPYNSYSVVFNLKYKDSPILEVCTYRHREDRMKFAWANQDTFRLDRPPRIWGLLNPSVEDVYEYVQHLAEVYDDRENMEAPPREPREVEGEYPFNESKERIAEDKRHPAYEPGCEQCEFGGDVCWECLADYEEEQMAKQESGLREMPEISEMDMAEELAMSWINGNRSFVAEALKSLAPGQNEEVMEYMVAFFENWGEPQHGMDLYKYLMALPESKDVKKKSRVTEGKVKEGQQTLWGKVQHVVEPVSGIQQVMTAGHGGFVLDNVRNAEVPQDLKNATFNNQGKGGYYEEDVDWAVPALVFFEELKDYFATNFGSEDKAREAIIKTLTRWYAKKVDLFPYFDGAGWAAYVSPAELAQKYNMTGPTHMDPDKFKQEESESKKKDLSEDYEDEISSFVAAHEGEYSGESEVDLGDAGSVDLDWKLKIGGEGDIYLLVEFGGGNPPFEVEAEEAYDIVKDHAPNFAAAIEALIDESMTAGWWDLEPLTYEPDPDEPYDRSRIGDY